MCVVTARPSGRPSKGAVDVCDVRLVQVVGIAADGGDVLALGGIVDVREAGVVELQVGTPQGGQALHLVGVRRRQVGPELVQVGVHRAVDRRVAAAVVHHARRGDGQLGHRAGGRVAQERERLTEDGVLDPHPSVDAHRRRGVVVFALLVAEAHMDALALDLAHAAELIDEVHVPRRAPELAVGGALQADVALEGDRIADRVVLDRAQLGRIDAPRLVVGAGAPDPLGPEQAADVVGAKRWARARGHARRIVSRRTRAAGRYVRGRELQPRSAGTSPRATSPRPSSQALRMRPIRGSGRSPRASSATCTRSSRTSARPSRSGSRRSTSSPAPATRRPRRGRSSSCSPTSSASRCW